MPTSTSPSHNSTQRWAKRGLASVLALAGACGRPLPSPPSPPSPLTPGAEPGLRGGLVAGAPSVTLGGDGELYVTDDSNGEPIGSIPTGTAWTVVIDTPGVRLVRPDGSRGEPRGGISAVNVTENRFAMANGRRYRGRSRSRTAAAGNRKGSTPGPMCGTRSTPVLGAKRPRCGAPCGPRGGRCSVMTAI